MHNESDYLYTIPGMEGIRMGHYIQAKGQYPEMQGPINIERNYVVYVEGNFAPKVIHKALDEATKEAQRLCMKEGKRTYVAEIMKAFKPSCIEIDNF